MPVPAPTVSSTTNGNWLSQLLQRLRAFNKAEAEWARMERELQNVLQSRPDDAEDRFFLALAV
jgi:hypothetical protein